MKTYFIQIKDNTLNEIIDICALKANSIDEAHRSASAAATGRGYINYSVQETTEEAFKDFLAAASEKAKAQAETEGKPAAPQPRSSGTQTDTPVATISLNGGPKVDILSEEGQALLLEAAKLAAAEVEAGNVPTVSINEGHAYAWGSDELNQALEDLMPPAQKPKEEAPAKEQKAKGQKKKKAA